MMVALFAVAWVVATKTPFGRHIYAIAAMSARRVWRAFASRR